MNANQYFTSLKNRLFDYQNEFGVVEPEADFFVSLLLASPEVKARLISNGINYTAIGLFAKAPLLFQHTVLQGFVTKIKGGEVYHAASPEPGSLSSVFKINNITAPDMEARKKAFDAFLESENGAEIIFSIRASLSAMDKAQTEITDLSLLQTIMADRDFSADYFTIAESLRRCGITKETLAADYKSPYAAQPVENTLV